jgi:D-glycero-D-manno-heptose 1,7-bisphosphate phosphatase
MAKVKEQLKVIFLDRDGVINEESGYTYKIEDFKFIEGVFDALRILKKIGYEFIIISNQSGISRKMYTMDEFNILNKWMIEIFEANQITITDVFICPHGPDDNCKCRKPKAGLFHKAFQKYDINQDLSWMIGDSERDITAADIAGIRNTILVRSGHEIKEDKTKAKYIIDSIKNLNQIITS